VSTVEQSSVRLKRPVYLTREGATLKLSFSYDESLVARVRELPFARFDGETKSWNVDLTRQAVETLREWYHAEGITDVYVDELLVDGEELVDAAVAVLRPGSLKRPFVVILGKRDDQIFARFRAVPGAQWEKQVQGLSYPSTSAVALSEMVSRGVLSDPLRLLQPAELTVTFDGRVGRFVVQGDSRAQSAFDKNFPARDVVAEWTEKGFDVAFADPFTEEVYRGEIARRGGGLQPDGLREPLFEYQAKNVAVAVERSGFAVWDQPGLGKTATAIGFGWELLENRKQTERVVVVVPGAVKTQFAREITRFTGDEVVVIDGDKKKREKLYAEAKTARWVVLNYDLLHLDYKMIAPLVSGSVLVADEAHRLKSRTSKRTQAMRQLAQKAARRLALSGTPIENNPGEWYTLMNNFVVPGVFGSPMEFFNRYSYPGRFGGFEGARNLGELRDRSRPHYIRHVKSEVATHLPPLMVKNMVLDPDEKLAAALKQAHRDAQIEIAEAAKDKRKLGVLDGEVADEIETGAAMTAVGMLRLMCSSPRLVWQSDAPAALALCGAGLVPEIDGPKLDELRLLAAELQAAGERLVVFTAFRSMAHLIAERLKEDGIRYVLFTGETSSSERDKAVAAFTTAGTESEPGPTIFLATDAASEGLNLGRCCSTLVNFDLSFKPSTLIQRANRIHRVDGDTTKRYLVINLTLARTIEEGILKLVGAKADLSDAILGEHGSRKNTTGRGGRNVFEQALKEWST
jgi:SNF2 family DNA or RNA helicase